MIEISVILPVYNKRKYLPKLFEQLHTQSFQYFECIIIDDGSTDGSEEICDTFAAEDPRVRVYHIVNGGVSHARNVGLDNAAGKYITFIDGDDEISPDYLKNLCTCAQRSNADLVIGGYKKFWDSGKQQNCSHPYGKGRFHKTEILSDFAKIQNQLGIYGYCWAKLFRAELSKGIRFDESIRLAEDLDFYLRLYPKIQSIYLDDKPNYLYRQEAENSSVLVRDDQIDYVSQLRINLRYRDFLVEENSYTGNNQEIVEQKINNYLYFSLFHYPQEQLGERFQLLRGICDENHVLPQGDHGMQKLCLTFLRKNNLIGVKAVLYSYWAMRRIRNTFRNNM